MRRVALGSGLDPGKLADTIRQIATSDPPLPVMICQADDNPDAWVHLTLTLNVHQDPPTPAAWVLMFGFPVRGDAKAALTVSGVLLPSGSEITSVQPGVHATLNIPFTTSLDEIAETIQQIMVRLQRVRAAAAVELALEYV